MKENNNSINQSLLRNTFTLVGNVVSEVLWIAEVGQFIGVIAAAARVAIATTVCNHTLENIEVYLFCCLCFSLFLDAGFLLLAIVFVTFPVVNNNENYKHETKRETKETTSLKQKHINQMIVDKPTKMEENSNRIRERNFT